MRDMVVEFVKNDRLSGLHHIDGGAHEPFLLRFPGFRLIDPRCCLRAGAPLCTPAGPPRVKGPALFDFEL